MADTGHQLEVMTLLARLEPSVARAQADGSKGADLVARAVRGNVLRTVAETRSRSPLLRHLEAEGRFAVLPAVYDLATGDVAWLKDVPSDNEPAAAPAGETRHASKAHGGHAAAGGHDDHGQVEHGDEPAHGGDGHATTKHGTTGHGSTHGEDHAAHGTTEGHDEHGGDHEPTSHDDHGSSTVAKASSLAYWLDPRMLLAGLGITSIVVTLLLLRRKHA